MSLGLVSLVCHLHHTARSSLAAYLGSFLAITVFLFAPQGIRADSLGATAACNKIPLSSGTGPLIISSDSCISDTGVGSINDSVSADYNTLAMAMYLNGQGNAEIFANWAENIPVGGSTNGQPIKLTFLYSVSGTYAFGIQPDASASFFANGELAVFDGPNLSGTSVYTEIVYRVFGVCGPQDAQCIQYRLEPTVGVSGQGVYQAFGSVSLNTTVGSMISASASINPQVGTADGTGYIDATDPSMVINVVATDPVTGVVIPGVTLTGDKGNVFRVNTVAAAPEPNSCFMSLIGIAGATVFVVIKARGVSLRCRQENNRVDVRSMPTKLWIRAQRPIKNMIAFENDEAGASAS